MEQRAACRISKNFCNAENANCDKEFWWIKKSAVTMALANQILGWGNF
tara:strand:+ start:93451 stop:93594 length:144 start_codon:yes stop_codon:yes gene_type:complete